MKKIIFTLGFCCIFLTFVKSQNLLSNVPQSAAVVIKYSGENFKTLVPLKKLDTYSFIKSNLFKMLDVDTLTSVKNMGINFEEDSYQYVVSEDSSLSFVTLLHLNNADQFLQLFKTTEATKQKTVQKDGYKFLGISSNTYIGWNEKTAMIVNTNYQFKESYWDYKYKNDTTIVATTTVEAVDSVVAVDAVRAVPPPPRIKKNGYKVPQKKGTGKKKVAPKKTKVKPKIDYDVAVSSASDPVQDSIENRKRDLWEQQQDAVVKKKQTQVADNIFSKAFAGIITSIEKKQDYEKVTNKDAHVSLWINSDVLISQYQNYFSLSMYRYMRYAKQYYNTDTTAGFKTGLNLYFDKEKIRMEQKSYSENAALEALGKSVLESKQNSSMLNFINPDNLGYVSMSINSEAMMNYYYTLMKKYFASSSYMAEYSDMVNMYIDLLQIMTDEKGIADLLPGNYMFVMHDMDTKMVDYIDYTYDSEYKSKQVKKSKKEIAPNFTFALETKREDFMQRLAKLPLKYTKKGNYDYRDKGGYYELVFDSGKYPLSNLYFMVKDGKGIITTSKTVIDNTLAGKGFAVDDATKNSILNNNYAVKVDLKKAFTIINSQASTTSGKQTSAYFRDNMNTIKTESGYKNGMAQGTTTLNINGNHTNSLEFIFNMIEALNKIEEDDKAEELKKAD